MCWRLKIRAAGTGGLATFFAAVGSLGVLAAPLAAMAADVSPAPALLSPPLALPSPSSGGVTPGVPDDYRLQRAGDGSGDLVYEAPGFTARVARDGTVRFRDRHVGVSALSLIPILPGPPPAGVPTLEGTLRGLGKKRRAPRADPRPDATPDETRDPATSFSRFRPDPREACQYPRPCFFDAPVLLVGAHARLDVTDEIMRMAGQDPYRYEKARFLTATRELRVRLAARAHAQDLARSGDELRQDLVRIACDVELRPAERRAILEALRAEIDTGTPEGQARADQIRTFIEEQERAQQGNRPDAGATCTPTPVPAPAPRP